jgi:hypothetical protein
MRLDRYAKAIAAGLVAAYAVYQIATGAASPAGVGVTFDEWVGIAMATITIAGGTWLVPNAKD